MPMNARQTMGGNRDGQSRGRLTGVRLAQLFAFGTLSFAVALSSGLPARAATTESGATGSAAASSTAPATETKPKTTSGKSAAGTYGLPQVEAINESVRKSWADHHLNPSPMATDGEWCRRVYLDTIGRIPSVEELTAFLSNRKPTKKLDLVNQLLGDKYVDEYARNWSNIWSTLLIGRPGNKKEEERSPVSREGMAQYLRRSFEKNKSYKTMVMELISATGSSKPGEDNYNGATNFLIGKMADNGLQATAKTAQLFLGLSVQCTQCHNHPFNEWKQNQFWELNAFFRQTHVTKQMEAKKKVDYGILTNVDFKGEGGDASSADLYYELRNGIVKVAYPVFVDGQQISRSGYMKESDRRTQLAEMIGKSNYLSKAIVNRMWGHFLGYGFTKPVDDMGPHNPPSNPDLLDRLSTDFAKNSYAGSPTSTGSATGGYDLKELIRWIVLSEPYALSSKYSGKNRTDDPTLGEKPQFSHFYLRQMSAEELYESMLVATAADRTKGNDEEREKSKREWMKQFTIEFGTDDGGETTTFNGTIPQTLMMFNGDMMKRATSSERGSLLEAVADNSRLSPEQKINYLYLAGLSRKPNSTELGLANQLLKDRRGSMAQALQDVWWAVLNSNEFILNH
jgi:hypothetical protein